MDIGPEQAPLIVEPVRDPFEKPAPAPAPPERQPVEEPAEPVRSGSTAAGVDDA